MMMMRMKRKPRKVIFKICMLFSSSEHSFYPLEEAMKITDMTDTNVTALRHTIYLTIMSSITFEECAHKLLKMTLKPGQEVRLEVQDLYIHS